ncbi:short-chain dehydrogenase TIC 32, chloroplastic [Cryptomeria japonica]|uniref:short-chain dehydrogenase TIC 32, chloroplastic n=1 Tax=Cryptomeria japonica TaxID=3369 RepID=UPI0027DA30FB|nr:short-chain dehydrogenase TIC 32, chloroplastic [Cryptomeria japonica]
MSWLRRTGPSGFSFYSTAEEVTEGIDATGLTAIVTGASRGIGTETARVLALRGAHVVLAVRNVDAGNTIKESIIKQTGNTKVDVLELDLSSISSVQNFVSNFKSLNLPVNILVNNAGVMACPFQLSQDGIELQFGTNHIGHFLLTNLLLENMKSTARESGIEGRIVNVSSEGHKLTYSEGIRFDKINDKSGYYAFLAYGQSKLANILHAKELARKFQEEGASVTANSVHPGPIPTNLTRYSKFLGFLVVLAKSLFKNIPQGASTTCYVALHPQLKGVSGKYFCDNNEIAPSKHATDQELARKLWEVSEKMVS